MTVREIEKTLKTLPLDAWLEDDPDYSKFDVYVKRPRKPRLWLGGILYDGFAHYRPSSINSILDSETLKNAKLADKILDAVEPR